MVFQDQTYKIKLAVTVVYFKADRTVDQEAARLQLLCLNNLFSLVKEVWRGLTTNQDRSHNVGPIGSALTITS